MPELTSWKEIATYLDVSVRTAQMWEAQRGLPVRRMPGPRGRVLSSTEELDLWNLSGTGPVVPVVGEARVASHPEPAWGWRKWGVAGAVAAVLAGSLLVGRQGQKTIEFTSFEPAPLTSEHGQEAKPSLAPDGLDVRYLEQPEGAASYSVVVRNLGTGEKRTVTTGLGEENSVHWSPDGERLAITRFDGGTAKLAVVAAGPGSLLRTKLPEGWGVSAGPGARALVMVEGVLDGERCAALREAVGRLRTFGVEGMVGAGDCRTVWPEWANRAGLGVRATVVDSTGVVRYEGRWLSTVAGIRAMGEGVLEWDRGRRAFAGSCGLCHGEDGTSEASEEAKSLAGVSTRMSDAGIVEHAERVGAVAVSTWPKAEAAALLTFIRGL